MNLADFASVAEIVSALGVIATLLFLAVELRKNTKATRQQSYHTIVSRRAAIFFEGISRDRETIEIFAKGLNAGDLDEFDAQRFLVTMTNLLSHFQDVYTEYQSGIVEKEVWVAERQLLAGFSGQPGFRNLWRELNQYYLPQFIAEVARIEPINLVVYNPETHDWERPDSLYLASINSRESSSDDPESAT